MSDDKLSYFDIIRDGLMHHSFCNLYVDEIQRCDCGVTDALDALDQVIDDSRVIVSTYATKNAVIKQEQAKNRDIQNFVDDDLQWKVVISSVTELEALDRIRGKLREILNKNRNLEVVK